MESRTQRILLNLGRAGALLVLSWSAMSAQSALAAQPELAAQSEFSAENGTPLIEPDLKPKKVDEALIDTENFEIGAYAGILNIEDFESSLLWGGRLTYHLGESFFVEVNAGFAEGGETSFEKLAGDVQLLPDGDRDYVFYNLNFGYKILPGEVFVGSYAFNTNFYLVGGAGATDFAGDNRFTLNYGAGYQVLLTDSLSVFLGVRQHLYDIDILGEEKTAFNTELSSGISLFF